MANQVVWVDIPVKNLDRAIGFYSAVLGAPVEKQEFSGMTFALLPDADSDVSGCLYQSADAEPSQSGPLVYFNANGRLDEATAAAAANGGTILKPPHPIGPHGSRSILIDSEGNRIALHSR